MDLRTQKYKICINSSWLVLIHSRERDRLDSKIYPVFVLLQSPKLKAIKKIMQEMADQTLQLPVIISTKSPQKTWKTILNGIPMIFAAGGIVRNPAGKFLFISRRGWWDLPKGKIEKGESTRKAALREVEEEVGLACKIDSILPPTFHVYRYKKEIVLKQTSWYLMSSMMTKPTLQKEEDIVDYKWIPVSRLNGMKSKVYPNLSVLIEEVELGLKKDD